MSISGESWFPIVGSIILKGNIPICSVARDSEAYAIMEALVQHNKEIPFTCISSTGFYCRQVDELPETEVNSYTQKFDDVPETEE